MNRNTGEIKEQTVFMGDFPMMTEKGTFIVNGTERVVVSQLVRSPGVIFEPGERFRLRNLTKHQLVKGTIHPYRGEWMEFDVEHKPGKDVTAGTRVARKRRLGIFTLLRALGYDEEQRPRLPRPLRQPLRLPRGPVGQGARHRPDPGRGARRDLQAGPPGRAAHGRVGHAPTSATRSSRAVATTSAASAATSSTASSAPKSPSSARCSASRARSTPRASRCSTYPDEDQNVLSRCEVLASISYMLHLVKQEPGYRLDDQDHFANRRIRSVGELIQNQVRIGLSRMERVVRERMTTQDVEAITPQTLINIRPVVAAIKEFFGTSPAVASSWTR